MDSTALGVGSVVALVFALWSASAGMRTLMEALNVAYHEEEARGLFRFYGTALLLTLGAVVSSASPWCIATARAAARRSGAG